MKALLLSAWLILSGLQGQADSLSVLFWNLENFFDWRVADSSSVSDLEFSSRGTRRWTRKRFQTKCQAIAKSILWLADTQGALPDAIGFAEVENAFVLKRLLRDTPLRKLDYGLVHFDSRDRRGIDVALLYRKTRLQFLEARPCGLYGPDGRPVRTRDMLLVRFREGDIIVCHHPSKFGGAKSSSELRKLAVERLRELTDSLSEAGSSVILVMGDFNESPEKDFYRLLEPRLVNLALPLQRKGAGSIKYDGEWSLIDQIWMSPSCAGSMEVLYLPFLQVPDKKHGGTKPLRTYEGPRYKGGVSDHCPVWGRAYLKN